MIGNQFFSQIVSDDQKLCLRIADKLFLTGTSYGQNYLESLLHTQKILIEYLYIHYCIRQISY